MLKEDIGLLKIEVKSLLINSIDTENLKEIQYLTSLLSIIKSFELGLEKLNTKLNIGINSGIIPENLRLHEAKIFETSDGSCLIKNSEIFDEVNESLEMDKNIRYKEIKLPTGGEDSSLSSDIEVDSEFTLYPLNETATSSCKDNNDFILMLNNERYAKCRLEDTGEITLYKLSRANIPSALTYEHDGENIINENVIFKDINTLSRQLTGIKSNNWSALWLNKSGFSLKYWLSIKSCS